MLSLWRAQIHSVVGKLRSHKQQDTAKREKKNEWENKIVSLIYSLKYCWLGNLKAQAYVCGTTKLCETGILWLLRLIQL